MKKFEFRYESILRLRKTKEDLAMRDYGQALENQRRVETELEAIYGSIEQSRIKSHDLQKEGGQMTQFCSQIETYIQGAYQKADRKKDEIERLSSISDSFRQKYMECYRDRKAMEKMSEKQEKRYKKEISKKQVKTQEDMLMARIAGRDSRDSDF